MSELFRRRMRLDVGVPGTTGRSWSELRLTCTIKKSGRPAPNSAEVTVTNLNADSRAWLEPSGLACQLFAGYEDAPPLLFVGQVDEVSHAYAGTEWTTTIQAWDGAAAFSKALDASTQRGATNSSEVLRRVASSMGLKLPSLPPELAVLDDPRGFQGDRRVRTVLGELSEELGFTWSIQSGALVLAMKGQASSPRVRLYKAGTGLIGSPEKTRRGVTLRVQLDARLVPGDVVQVESKVVSGSYRIATVEHSADSHEGDFVTTVEAVRL